MKRESDTKQKILDAAQYLFAREGFKGTSLREITGMAGVNIASINYHFGSKEALLKAVLERKLIPLNEIRMERLRRVADAARKRGTAPMVKDLLLAFIEPTFQLKDKSPDASDFIVLVGRAFYDSDNTVRRAFIELVWPLYELIVKVFREALPQIPKQVLIWRLHFLFGSLSHVMLLCGSTFYAEIREFPLATDTKSVMKILIPFMTAGIESK
jgi:AcrR family transcriptional regulator